MLGLFFGTNGLLVINYFFLSFAFSIRRNIPGPTTSASPGKFLEMQIL